MPKDPRKWCGECGDKVDTYEWCDTCASYLCEHCGELHDCLTGMLEEKLLDSLIEDDSDDEGQCDA